MKREQTLFALAAIIILAATIFLFSKKNQNSDLPPDIYHKLGCDRLTQELRSTDIYCHDYQLYKKDHAAGKV
jgi:hypothetical protein